MRTNTKPVATKVTVTTTTTTQRHTTATPKPATTTSKQTVTTTTTSKQTTTAKPVTTSKPASKPQSKPSSQAPSKKVEIQKVVVSSNGDEIKDTLEFFDANGDGRINAREIRGAMQNIGYDEKNPMVYEVMTELDNPRNKNQGGATFNDFCQTVNYRVPERESDEDLRRVFNLFLDDPNSETTSLESIKRVADELGENIEELELNAMLNKATKSGAKLTFDDFVAIMTGNTNL
jgi:Ca2+-binding EF-hand superfamily protein